MWRPCPDCVNEDGPADPAGGGGGANGGSNGPEPARPTPDGTHDDVIEEPGGGDGGAATPSPRQGPRHRWSTMTARVVQITEEWGASMVLTAHPEDLLEEARWAETGADAIPASGDGIAQVCRLLAQDSSAEDPTV
eukprot:7536785-Lingulodinium_polyedra.AAC.1